MIKPMDLVIVIGGTILVVLFFGPGMWSSDTEFFAVRLWRRWRGKEGKASKEEKPGKPPNAGGDGPPPTA